MLFFKKVFIDTQFKNWANSVTFCIGYRCLEGFDRLCGQSTLLLHLAHLLILTFVWHQGICSGAASPAPFLPWPCPFTVTHLCISWFWLLINHLIFYIWYHYFFLIKHLFFLAMPHSLRDFSSPTRDRTRATAMKARILTTRPPGNSRNILYFIIK